MTDNLTLKPNLSRRAQILSFSVKESRGKP